MQPTRACHGCEERLTTVSNVMRRHLTQMRTALDLARNDQLSDEQRRLFTDGLVETLHQAQSAWDAYLEHLDEHGLLALPEPDTRSPR